jgi:hypothetical protein
MLLLIPLIYLNNNFILLTFFRAALYKFLQRDLLKELLRVKLQFVILNSGQEYEIYSCKIVTFSVSKLDKWFEFGKTADS